MTLGYKYQYYPQFTNEELKFREVMYFGQGLIEKEWSNRTPTLIPLPPDSEPILIPLYPKVLRQMN